MKGRRVGLDVPITACVETWEKTLPRGPSPTCGISRPLKGVSKGFRTEHVDLIPTGPYFRGTTLVRVVAPTSDLERRRRLFSSLCRSLFLSPRYLSKTQNVGGSPYPSCDLESRVFSSTGPTDPNPGPREVNPDGRRTQRRSQIG